MVKLNISSNLFDKITDKNVCWLNYFVHDSECEKKRRRRKKEWTTMNNDDILTEFQKTKISLGKCLIKLGWLL